MRNRPRQVQRPSLWEDLWRMRYGKDEPEDAKYRARRERDFLEEYERRKQELLAQRLRMERLVEALEGELVGLTPRSIHIVRGMVERRGSKGRWTAWRTPGRASISRRQPQRRARRNWSTGAMPCCNTPSG